MIENFRLRVFRTVARHLSFSRAAEELLLTQPAVTQQIKALEDELGVSLFDRGGGHIRLTPGGKALVPFADKMRLLSEGAVQAVAAAYGESGGNLALGASQTIAQYLLPALIAAFRKSHPRVRVTALSGNTDAMLEAMVAGRIDLALIEGPERRQDLQIETFMEDPMILVVPPGHEWAGQVITAAMLQGEPFLMREFGSGSRRVIEQAFAANGLKVKDIRISMELDSTEGLLSAVEAGLGVTFVSRLAACNRLALGTLRLAYAKDLKTVRWFSLARPSGPEPRGNVEAFRGLLLSHALELVPRRPTRSKTVQKDRRNMPRTEPKT